jgi:hypothetical protein
LGGDLNPWLLLIAQKSLAFWGRNLFLVPSSLKEGAESREYSSFMARLVKLVSFGLPSAFLIK